MKEYFRLHRLFITTNPILIFGVLVLSNMLFLLEPFELVITEQIINRINDNYSVMIGLVIILVLILSFMDFQFTLSMPFIEIIEYKISSILQDKLAFSVTKRNITDFDRKSELEKIYRAKRCVWYNITNIIVENIFFIGSLVSLILTIKIIIAIDMKASVLIVLLSLFQNVLVMRMANDEIKMIQNQDEIKRYISYLKETLIKKNNVKEITSYNLFDWLEEKIDIQFGKLKECNTEYLKKWFNISIILNCIYQLCDAGIIVIFLLLMSKEKINIAGFIVLYQSRSMILSSTERIFDHFTSTVKSADYIKVVFEEIDNKVNDKGTDYPYNDENIVEIENLFFGYKKEYPVLEDINLNIKKGEVLLLVGENGSGKSSLVKVILGLITEYQGTVRKKYNKCSVAFQDYTKFMLSLRENIGFGDLTKLYDDSELIKAIDKGDSLQIYKKCNNDLETILGNEFAVDGKELSEGQWQRVCVSRAFVGENELIVFDEPAASLDPIAEYRQFEKIKKEFVGKTVVLISHRVGLAKFADRIVFMDKGKIQEVGTHEELLSKRGDYYNFYEAQAKWYEI